LSAAASSAPTSRKAKSVKAGFSCLKSATTLFSSTSCATRTPTGTRSSPRAATPSSPTSTPSSEKTECYDSSSNSWTVTSNSPQGLRLHPRAPLHNCLRLQLLALELTRPAQLLTRRDRMILLRQHKLLCHHRNLKASRHPDHVTSRSSVTTRCTCSIWVLGTWSRCALRCAPPSRNPSSPRSSSPGSAGSPAPGSRSPWGGLGCLGWRHRLALAGDHHAVLQARELLLGAAQHAPAVLPAVLGAAILQPAWIVHSGGRSNSALASNSFYCAHHRTLTAPSSRPPTTPM
jgi:hypothetical protein